MTPGTTRLEANGRDQFLPQFITEKKELLRDAAELVIDVNAAIFADGTLVGPGEESYCRLNT